MNFLYRLAMCILFTGFSLCLFPQTTGEIQRLEREISELRQLISRENANLQMMRNNSRNEGDIERLAYYIQTLEHSLVTKQKTIEYLRQQEAERLRREAELQRALEEKVREAQKKKKQQEQQRLEQQKAREQAQREAEQRALAEERRREQARRAAEERARWEAEQRAIREARGEAAYRDYMNKSAGANIRNHNYIDAHAQDQERVTRDVTSYVAGRSAGLTPLQAQPSGSPSSGSPKNLSGLMQKLRTSNPEMVDAYITRDVRDFLLTYLDNLFDGSLDNSLFCNYITEKICDRYQVNKLAFFNGQCDMDTRRKIADEINRSTDKANELLRSTFDQWNRQKNAPKWQKLAETLNDNQLISTLNILSTSNGGELPTPMASDADYYYYLLPVSGELARISQKEKGSMEIIDTDLRHVSGKSFKEFFRGQAEPLTAYRAAFQQHPRIRKYALKEDGSATEKHISSSGEVRKYKIEKPEIKFYHHGGAVLQNSYSENTQFDHQYTTDLTLKLSVLNASLETKYDLMENESEWSLSLNYDARLYSSQNGSKLTASGTVKSPLDKSKVKLSANLTPHVQGSVSVSADGQLSASGKLKNGVSSVKFSRSALVEGDSTSTSFGLEEGSSSIRMGSTTWKNTIDIKPIDKDYKYFGISLGVASSHQYQEQSLQNDENRYVNQLPADLVARLYTHKIKEIEDSKAVFYADYEDDTYGNPVKKPVSPSEINKMKEDFARIIRDGAHNEDYECPPSDFNGFVSCYVMEE